MSGILVFILDKVATKNYHELDQSLFAYQTIASPNTQIDSQVIANSSILGGEVVTNQSKNIDGYIVPGVVYIVSTMFLATKWTIMNG